MFSNKSIEDHLINSLVNQTHQKKKKTEEQTQVRLRFRRHRLRLFKLGGPFRLSIDVLWRSDGIA